MKTKLTGGEGVQLLDHCLWSIEFASSRFHWAVARPSTALGLGASEWSPEGLHDKRVSWIPNTDEILKLVKKKMN